jgi:dUTP pyrophosphatase
MPVRASAGSAGFDICANHSGEIAAGQRGTVDTGVHMEIPDGYFAKVEPRSGLAVRNGIAVLGGVIDSDYRGEIKVILYNCGGETFTYHAGMRIAQLVVHKLPDVRMAQAAELGGTARGTSGFGSTGA